MIAKQLSNIIKINRLMIIFYKSVYKESKFA